MKSKHGIDLTRVGQVMGAELVGRVAVRGGGFGSLPLAVGAQVGMRTPSSGGRATDPRWTEKRLVPFAPSTLEWLKEESVRLSESGVSVAPFQIAARIIEAHVPAPPAGAELASKVLGPCTRRPLVSSLSLWEEAA